MTGALDALGAWCTAYGYLVDRAAAAAVVLAFVALVVAAYYDPPSPGARGGALCPT